jgi:hypothetical protein
MVQSPHGGKLERKTQARDSYFRRLQEYHGETQERAEVELCCYASARVA